MFRLAVGEFVDVTATLEAEMFNDKHRGLGGQHRHVEYARALDELVRIVVFVDRHRHLQGIAGDLHHRVDDAAVVDVAVTGGQHIKTITDVG